MGPTYQHRNHETKKTFSSTLKGTKIAEKACHMQTVIEHTRNTLLQYCDPVTFIKC